MTTSDILCVLTIIIALVAVLVSAHQNRQQTKIFYEQLKLSFFADYTKRYQEIFLNLPHDIHDENFDFNKYSLQEKQVILRYFRVYFDLCSEEYYLWLSGKIDQEVWENWKEGIIFTMKRKAFKEAWSMIKSDSCIFEKFRDWINKEVLS